MGTTAFLPILSAFDRLFIGHTRGPAPGTQPAVTHVAFGILVDYVRGLGTAATREQVREHLSTCAHCGKTAGGLQRLGLATGSIGLTRSRCLKKLQRILDGSGVGADCARSSACCGPRVHDSSCETP